MSDLNERLAAVRLLAMDVDGVLTDGTLGYDNDGNEQKRFHVADGMGLVLMRQAGIEIAWITGRGGAAVERRAQELGVRHLVQGARDKRGALLRLCSELGTSTVVPLSGVAYIGDDWNDLPALAIAGVAISVADACEEAQNAAHIVTQRRGGRGAVREVCELILDARGERQSCLAAYLASLAQPPADHEQRHSGQ